MAPATIEHSSRSHACTDVFEQSEERRQTEANTVNLLLEPSKNLDAEGTQEWALFAVTARGDVWFRNEWHV